MRKKAIALVLIFLMLVGISGCGKNTISGGMESDEIITTDAVDQSKTMITVRVEFGAGQSGNLESVLEEKFPDVDIVLRHDGSTSSVYTMNNNLAAGVECDLILSRRLPVVADIAKDYLLDLSSEDFVDNYYMAAVDSCADSEGKIYYLPGPSDVYGIVYDKTMFDENGWELPDSYTGFVELLDTISQSDAAKGGELVPIQASIMYPDMFQILFNTYGYDEVYGGVDNFAWLTDYQQGNGTMTGHMEAAAEKFKKLFDDGILSAEDFDVAPSKRSEMMYVEHSTAMIIECQNAVDYNESLADADDIHELSMMPFWTSDESDSDYLYSIPSYYMAINKSAAQESKEKKELLLDIYSYLSSVEGQEMLIGDDFQVSNIEGVPLNYNTFSENVINTISRGHMINTFYLAAGETDKQVERQMLSTAEDMIQGNITIDEWLKAADDVRDKFISGDLLQEEVYGQADTTLTRLETAYTVAQMYSDLTDAPIAICYGGGWNKSTNGYLYQGDITDSSLECITPNKEQPDDDSENYEIVTSYMTGQQIVDTLNSSMSISDTKGLYPYYVAVGLSVEFNPWADEGSRVLSCKLPDGEDIDLNEVYQVAYYYGSLPDTNLEIESSIDMTWKEAFIKWLDDIGGVIEKPDMTVTLIYE